MAGLCAAVAAAEAGASTHLVEIAPTVGGSMALSGGMIWAPKNIATARQHIPKGDPALQKLLVDGLRPLWKWLVSLGMPLEPEIQCMKDGLGVGRAMGLGSASARGLWAEAMVEVGRRFGLTVHMSRDTTGIERVRDRWRLIGADAVDQPLEVDTVIAASGGFQNNKDMLRRYVTTQAEHLVVRSNRWSSGVPMRFFVRHGAVQSGGMACFYGHTLPKLPGGIDPKDFIAASQYYSQHCVLLNRHGLRFTDESIGVIDEHNALQGSRQPEATYYLVFDQSIREDFVVGDGGLPGVPGIHVPDRMEMARSLGAHVVEASTLQELAANLDFRGVPAQNVLDSLKAYNNSTDPVRSLFPPRTLGHRPLVVAPFYAVECLAGITYTMGGLAIDAQCRVLNGDGVPIPGLFAAGADAGGVFQDFYGGGLAWSGVSGCCAGLGAAAI
jgi:fumarate reductase flavoprotein subunit